MYRKEEQESEEKALLPDMDSEPTETEIEPTKETLPRSNCFELAAEEAKKKKNMHLPSASLHLLKELHERKCILGESCMRMPLIRNSCCQYQDFSTVDIISMSRETLITLNHTPRESGDHFSYAAFGFPPERFRDFELALLLQAAAFSFSNQHFNVAINLLGMCQRSASITGNPLQRVVFYFTEALLERIMMEMGEIIITLPKKEIRKKLTIDEAFTSFHPDIIELENKLPFRRVTQFTAIQAILDNIVVVDSDHKRVHLIDLGIKNGSQWPILMQALADKQDYNCQIELLRITAVAPYRDKERIDEIGKRLSSFAENLNIPFAFSVVVSDLKNLKEDLFELSADEDEVIAVYSELCLATLLAWPDRLESLLGTMERLRPKLMVIVEAESRTNTSIFIDRFTASLSISAAVFDCLEVCMNDDQDNQHYRDIVEGGFLKEGIQYNITSKGEESIHRQESIEFWRGELTRHGMLEMVLSDHALCQANLVTKSNRCWSSCTLDHHNGKGLTIGWKGTPILFLTVWKFT